MSNVDKVKRGSITITTSDNITRPIRFTMNTFAALEEQYGSIDKAMEAMQSGSIKAIRNILWLGLSVEDGTLTETQVGDLIDIADFADIMGQLGKAMGFDLPAKNEGDRTDPN